MPDLRARLDSVRDRLARAARRAGRDPTAITLVAISKTFPAADIRAAAAAGQIQFGENKVQEALRKMGEISDLALTWHLVGHLQSNKARKAAEHFDVIHSVHNRALVAALDEAALSTGRRIELLIQVDLAKEPTKHGAAVDELVGIFDAGQKCTAVRITGLMLLPPASEDPQDARPHFVALQRLRDMLLAKGVDAAQLAQLSMGMSHDFEVAVEEGATIVRVGSAIFGARTSTPV